MRAARRPPPGTGNACSLASNGCARACAPPKWGAIGSGRVIAAGSKASKIARFPGRSTTLAVSAGSVKPLASTMQPLSPMSGTEATLYADLDGTVLSTDLLYESFLSAFKRSPWVAVQCIGWLLQGRARLKEELAARASIDVASRSM